MCPLRLDDHDTPAFSGRALLARLLGAPTLALRVMAALLRPKVLLSLTLIIGVAGITGGAKLARQWPIIAPVARAVLTPGTSTHQLSALDPAFRTRVERVLVELRQQGFKPRVRTTWRSPDRQELIFVGGRLSERLRNTGPATRARGGMSCHNLTDDQHVAASLAADISASGNKSGAGHARFYRALGEAAHAEGLVWGGDWRRSNRTWARYDLGWDPGHVQSPRCSVRKRRAARARYLGRLESP
jgi:hypothetical protein